MLINYTNVWMKTTMTADFVPNRWLCSGSTFGDFLLVGEMFPVAINQGLPSRLACLHWGKHMTKTHVSSYIISKKTITACNVK